MQSRKHLTIQIAGAAALAMLVGTSAFAESRHHERTSSGSSGRIERSSGNSGSSSRSNGSWHSRAVEQSPQRYESRGNGNIQRYESRANTPRQYEYRGNAQQQNVVRGNTEQQNIYRGGSQQQMYRGDTRQRGEYRGNGQQTYQRGTGQRDSNYGWRGNGAHGNVVLPRGVESDRFHHVEGWHGGAAPYRSHERVSSYGRVSHYEPWHGGYRVWLDGGLFPIWVPFSYWTHFPLHVGLYIRFGGWWDPFGYWNVNDYAPYYGPGYYATGPAPYYPPAYTTSVVRGTVQSIDFVRGTMFVVDQASNQAVTILMPRDRRMEDIHPGDYVEFSGDWNGGGVFDAYRLERWGGPQGYAAPAPPAPDGGYYPNPGDGY